MAGGIGCSVPSIGIVYCDHTEITHHALRGVLRVGLCGVLRGGLCESRVLGRAQMASWAHLRVQSISPRKSMDDPNRVLGEPCDDVFLRFLSLLQRFVAAQSKELHVRVPPNKLHTPTP